MYSRSFSDRSPIPPPEYSGTAWRREHKGRDTPPGARGEAHQRERDEGRDFEREEHSRKEESSCKEDSPCKEEPSCKERPHRREDHPCKEEETGRGSLLGRLLPFGIKEEDLLLLGIALLLLLDGCEDTSLPLILLFLLIVH